MSFPMWFSSNEVPLTHDAFLASPECAAMEANKKNSHGAIVFDHGDKDGKTWLNYGGMGAAHTGLEYMQSIALRAGVSFRFSTEDEYEQGSRMTATPDGIVGGWGRKKAP